MAEMPTSLNDILPAPEVTDDYGNHLFHDWSLSFPPIRFNMSHLDAMRVLSYETQVVWPMLYDFINGIIENVEAKGVGKSMMRKLVIGATSSDPAWANDLSHSLLGFKSLLAVALIGLISSFIIIPVIAFCTYRQIKKRCRRRPVRYTPSLSESLTAVSHHKSTNDTVSRLSVPLMQRPRRPYLPLLITALFASFIALLVLGAAFHSNESFSHSTIRISTIVDEAMNDVAAIIGNFMHEFETVGDVIVNETTNKMPFLRKIMDSLGNILNNERQVTDLMTKSQALQPLLLIVSWEKAVMEPLVEALTSAENLTRQLSYAETNLTLFRNDKATMDEIRALCTTSYDKLTTTCDHTAPLQKSSDLCATCFVPNVPAGIDPLLMWHYVSRRGVNENISSLLNQTLDMMSTKLGKMITRDDLIHQFTGIGDVLSQDLTSWIDHYKQWLENYVSTPTAGSGANISTEAASSMLPHFTKREPKTNGNDTAEATGSIASTLPTLSPIAVALDQIQDAFGDRYYAVLALLCLAAIQLALMIVGSICFLAENCRPRQASRLETVGCNCILAGSIIFISFTGPLLCLAASAHFYTGGLIERSICQPIRMDDHKLLDEMLNTDESGKTTNILRYILPEWITALVDSVDKDLLNSRLTIGKFLTAAKNGQTLNQYLMLNDTDFVREVKNLTYLNLTANFVVYNAKLQAYMDDMTKLMPSCQFFDKLIKEVDVNGSNALADMLRNCTACVVRSILMGTSVNYSAVNDNFDQQLDDGLQYHRLLKEYVAALPNAHTIWSNSLDALRSVEEQKEIVISSMRNVEDYFRNIVYLLKGEMSYMISMLVDNLSEAITRDIGRLEVFYDFYQGLLGQYACVEVIGSLNAFWFFVGSYLVFSTISSLLLLATHASLTYNTICGLVHSDSMLPSASIQSELLSSSLTKSSDDNVTTRSVAYNSDTSNIDSAESYISYISFQQNSVDSFELPSRETLPSCKQ